MISNRRNRYKFLLPMVLTFGFYLFVSAQISPGDLSRSHAQLEGISNCTQCHTAGKQVSRDKCLSCHKEINAEIIAHKGFHASSEVGQKNCAQCHKDHQGRDFDMRGLNKKTFNHDLTGFKLKGQHARQECSACHNASHIKEPALKKRAGTFLGLSQDCMNCHDDYHQGRLSSRCTDCHNFNSFKNATGFDHSKTKFSLLGQHKKVACVSCHKIEMVNGKRFQRFNGLEFANCTACHTDVHHNKFGQDCKRCHTEESFHFNKNMKAFDHDKTDFPLIGEHKQVDCRECHTSGNMTRPLKHDQCQDCHTDYHKGEFTRKDGSRNDCSTCHTNNGFSPSTFTIEQHNQQFKLEGAHLATSCMACHRKEEHWTFRKIGKNCVDCHKNEHAGFMDERFMPNSNCAACHNVNNWSKVTFNHHLTGFQLTGKHNTIACSSCHYVKNENGARTQRFKGLSSDCENCHKEPHAGQFAVNGHTDCTRCHGTDSWTNSRFDHSTSRFKLEGAHANVICSDCHQKIAGEKGIYIKYKFADISCAVCHKK